MHTYINTYIRKCIRTFVRTYIHSYIHTHTHTHTRLCNVLQQGTVASDIISELWELSPISGQLVVRVTPYPLGGPIWTLNLRQPSVNVASTFRQRCVNLPSTLRPTPTQEPNWLPASSGSLQQALAPGSQVEGPAAVAEPLQYTYVYHIAMMYTYPPDSQASERVGTYNSECPISETNSNNSNLWPLGS